MNCLKIGWEKQMEEIKMKLGTEHTGDNRKDYFALWFLVLSLISGLLIAFFTPPMCSPDENAHFMNAYAVSRGDFFPEIVDGVPSRYVEERVLGFVWNYNSRFQGNYSEKYSFSEQYFNSYLNDENATIVQYPSNLNTINPFCYLPAAFFMGLWRLLGKIFSFPLASLPYNLLMFGRLGNLLFYSIVTYFALRKAPCFRRVLFLLAMMPITLFLGASVNYDAILISVSFLFLAEVGKLITESPEKKITIGDIACVLFCTFFLVGVKQAYATLLLMLLAVPKKKYGSTKKMIICVGMVFFTGIVAYTPIMIINHICKDISNDSSTPYIIAQTEYVKSHLSEIPKIFINTIKSYRGFYLESFWGKLGQLDTNIPFPFMLIFYCLLIMQTVIDVMTVKLWDRQWKRILPFAAVSVSIVGIFGSMYLYWTPLPGIADGVGTQYISGVQGRYLIELFIPAFSVWSFSKFAESRFMKKISKFSNNLIYVWTVICSLLTPMIIFARYW